MRGFKRALLFVSVIAALLVAGCAPPAKTVGGVEPTKPRLQSIVSLSPSATEIVVGCLAFTRGLTGRTASCNYPQNVLSAPIVMDGVKPNYERLSQIKPDAIVYDSSLFGEADLAKLKEMGVELFDMHADTLDQYGDNIRKLAARCAAETNASEYIDKVEVQKQKGLSFAVTPTPTVAIILPGQGSENMIAGVEGFLADATKYAGAKLVGPNSKKFETIGPEALMALNPEVIITSGEPSKFLADTRMRGLRAVQRGNVFGFQEPDVLLRAGARVDKLVERLSNMIRIKK